MTSEQPADRRVMLRLPPPEQTPAYVDSLRTQGQLEIETFDERTALVQPRATAEPFQPFTAFRLCDANTTITDATWDPIRECPPFNARDERRARLLELAGDAAQDEAAPLPKRFAGLRASVMALGEDLPDFLTGQMPVLFSTMPDASLWFVRADPVLVARATAIRTQLAITLTPDIPLQNSDFQGLSVLEGHTLTHGMSFASVYDPVTLAFSPAATGITLSCPPHALVLFFGTQLELRRDADADLSHLYGPSVLDQTDPWDDEAFRRRLAAEEAEALLPWWTKKLSVLYDHATDPTRFATALGVHDAAAQTAWFLTLERLIADGISLLADPSASDLMRVETAFDLLNKAESLLGYSKSGPGFKHLLRRSSAVPRLRSAWDSMPEPPRKRFRKHTQATYDSLYAEIRENTLANRLTKNGVLVAARPEDAPRPISMDDYVSRLMRAVRNSAHGMARQLRPPHDTLMATNTGDVPSAFAQIAPLVMFALVADAERLLEGAWWE